MEERLLVCNAVVQLESSPHVVQVLLTPQLRQSWITHYRYTKYIIKLLTKINFNKKPKLLA
jgi:hypothetical protein